MCDRHVLLYSEHCSHSERFIKELYKDQNIYNMITRQCIDNCKFKIPSNIKMVPALIIKSNDGYQTYQGKEVFDWLVNLRNQISQETNRNVSNEGPSMAGGIECYDPVTMNSSLSDSFSNLQDTAPMSHCYQFLNDNNGFTNSMGGGAITTPSTNEMDGFKQDTNKRLEQFIAQRNMDIPQPDSRQ